MFNIIVYFQVFGLLRQGEGRIIITASSEDKMQKVRLPVLETEVSAWEFFEILFEELRCEPFYEKEPHTSTRVKNEKTTTLTFSASAASLSPPLRFKKEEQVCSLIWILKGGWLAEWSTRHSCSIPSHVTMRSKPTTTTRVITWTARPLVYRQKNI